MTQKELILKWIEEHGSITPAKMSGTVYYETMFGSETSKRCREMRAKGSLESYQEGKFLEYLGNLKIVHVLCAELSPLICLN